MQVAVLLPFQRDRDGLSDAPDGYQLHWLEDPQLSFSAPRSEFDIVAYTERCSDYIDTHAIDALLYSHEPANLIAAVLCERHGLPGPSLDAMLVSNHKALSRQAEPDPLASTVIDLETGDWDGQPFYPCYLKPAYLWQSLFQFRIDRPQQLDDALTLLRRELPPHNRPYQEFFARYVDGARYPLVQRSIAVIEAFLDHREQHCVMGWSDAAGEAQLWGIYDRLFYPGAAHSADVSLAPSELPPDEKRDIFALSAELARRHGIRGGFWNVDLCRVDDRWRVIEVNGRAATVWHELHALAHGNSLFNAMLFLACGQQDRCRAETAAANAAGRVAGQFHLVTEKEGRAGNLIDFPLANALTDTRVDLLVGPDQQVRQTSSAGFVLARFHLSGPDRATIRRRAEQIRERLLI